MLFRRICWLVSLSGFLAISGFGQNTTNFWADFDAASPQDLTLLADNSACSAALDAGTAVGNWAVSNMPGYIFSIVDDGAGNCGLVFDIGPTNLDSLVAVGYLSDGKVLIPEAYEGAIHVSFKWMKTDPGGGNVEQTYFELYNQAGFLVAGLRWADGTSEAADDGPIAHSEGTHGSYIDFDPVFDVNKDQSGSADPYDPANMIRVKMKIWRGSVVYKIDTDLDGNYELVSTNSTVDRANVANFQLWVKNNKLGGNPGAWFDDIRIFTGLDQLLASPGAERIAVNFSRDVTVINGDRPLTVSNGTQRVIGFDDSTPFFSGNRETGRRVYLGWSGEIADGSFVSEEPKIGEVGLLGDVESDTGAATGNMLLIWDKADFIDGTDFGTWGFDGTANSVLSADIFRNDGTAYFVLREGSEYYVSDFPMGQGQFQLTGTNGANWAEWNPTANGGVDFAAIPISGYGPVLFSNITAVGIIGTDYSRPSDKARFIVNNVNEGFSARLVSMTTPYEYWAQSYGLSGDSAVKTENPDGDAVDNVTEYGLGGDPTDQENAGHIPTFRLVEENGTNWLEYVYPKRVEENSGLAYILQTSKSLSGSGWTNGGYQMLEPFGAFDADYFAVTNRIPTADDTAQFIRLSVESR